MEMRTRSYGTDLSDEQWALVEPILPKAKPGGRPRSVALRAVVNAIFYLLRSGCQWRLLPHDFPAWQTVYYYFRRWDREAVWQSLLDTLNPLFRRKAGRSEAPSVAIMDSQSVKTTEKGAFGALMAINELKEGSGISWSIL
jgi:putative transposase